MHSSVTYGRKLKELYIQEIDQSHLNAGLDPEYQQYYTQAAKLWKEEDMPDSIYRLLDTGNFLSFAHGFCLEMQLAG